MIRWFYLFILFAFLFACDTASNIKSPNQNYFLKYFGGNGDQKAVDLIVNSDGTFYILGNSRVSPDAIQKVYLAHANAQGEVIKQITYGVVEMEARDFILTSDGKIAVVANKGTTNTDILLSRFTTDLVMIDTALLSGPSNNSSDYANSLTELNNGDFIVEGYQTGNPKIQELHIKVYNQIPLAIAGGEWLQSGGAGADNRGVKTFEQYPSSKTYRFYTFGNTNGTYNQSTNTRFWTYPLPSNGSFGADGGDISMFEIAGGGMENTLTDVVRVQTLGYLLVGISASPSGYKLKAAVTVNTDSALSFSPTGVLQDVLLQDLGFGNATAPPPFATTYSSINNYNFILANIYNSAQATSDILLMKVHNDLSYAWDSPYFVQFGGDGDDTAAAVAELPDGHIMVLGTMRLGNPPAQFKIALMKLNASGKLAD